MSFFGACFFFGLFRLLSKRRGLILTTAGFEDHSSFIGGHFIGWQLVKNIHYFRVQKQRFIRVIVKDPENLISKAEDLQKIVMPMNYRFYGSPGHISANSLAYRFNKLQEEFYGTWHTSER